MLRQERFFVNRSIDYFLFLVHSKPCQSTVDVAQLVERQTVDLGVAGSSPVIHPCGIGSGAHTTYAFVAQLDRATDFESVGRGFESLRTQNVL